MSKLTQYEIDHMENIMVRDGWWNDNLNNPTDDDWDEEDEFEEDEIDDFD